MPDGTAARKAELLARAGADVVVVSPNPGSDIDALAATDRITLAERAFVRPDLEGRAVVVAATGDAASDARVAKAARRHRVPVNVVDARALSTFIVPAIVDRDPVTVAISSGGAAPMLARGIRARIEAMLPAGLGRLARFAEGFRGAVRGTMRDAATRRRFWERFFAGAIAEAVLAGDERWVRERMIKAVNGQSPSGEAEGVVHLVARGPAIRTC